MEMRPATASIHITISGLSRATGTTDGNYTVEVSRTAARIDFEGTTGGTAVHQVTGSFNSQKEYIVPSFRVFPPPDGKGIKIAVFHNGKLLKEFTQTSNRQPLVPVGRPGAEATDRFQCRRQRRDKTARLGIERRRCNLPVRYRRIIQIKNKQDMHTTHSHLLKLGKAAALCAALFLCACSYERIPDVEEGELMTVTLSAGPAAGEQNLTSKAGLTDTQENSIHDLYILAFQPDATGAFFLKYYATGRSVSGGGGGQFSFTLRRSVSGAADTKLLLVANQNPYPLVNIGMTYEGYKQL